MDWTERAVIARHRLAHRLADDNHPYPEFAACLIVARGSRAMNVEQFAGHAGVDLDVLAKLEAGEQSPATAPDSLIELADREE